MIQPLRIYGLNVGEIVLAGLLRLAGWLTLAVCVLTLAAPRIIARPASELLLLSLLGAVALLMAAGGVRQNRATFALARLLTLAASVFWLISARAVGSTAHLAIGSFLLVVVLVAGFTWRKAMQLRFKPRFFAPRQFETMLQIADVMFDGQSGLAMSPTQIAVNTDHFLSEIRAPATGELKFVMVMLEWVAPLLSGYPVPFTLLGSHARRRVVERVIYGRGPFRDIARSVKLLACAGYYGVPDGMAAVGYVPFNDRPRGKVDQTPLIHPRPSTEAIR